MIMTIICKRVVEIDLLAIWTSIRPLIPLQLSIMTFIRIIKAPRDVKGFCNACVYSADGDSSPSSNHASTARPSAAR